MFGKGFQLGKLNSFNTQDKSFRVCKPSFLLNRNHREVLIVDLVLKITIKYTQNFVFPHKKMYYLIQNCSKNSRLTRPYCAYL